jgi:mannose-6-phosphate isomerase-like protein (cupin superfamily)
MIRTGDVIENPISGETMVFLQTADDTDGELLQIDLFVAPDGAAAGEHMHPKQEERFIVRRGEMTIEIDGEQRVLRAGDEAVVAPGTPHVWWNSGERELNAILEFRPAGRFAPFISTFFGLARAGQVDDDGLPPLLQTAVTLREYRDTVAMTDVSPTVSRYVLPTLAFFGKMLGIRPEYPYPRRSRVNRGMEIWRAEGVNAA